MSKKIPSWRLILFIEMLSVVLIFCVISGYILWTVWFMDQYCYMPEKCMALGHWTDKIKLAIAGATMFIYSFSGVFAVLFTIPFAIRWLISFFTRQ